MSPFYSVLFLLEIEKWSGILYYYFLLTNKTTPFYKLNTTKY